MARQCREDISAYRTTRTSSPFRIESNLSGGLLVAKSRTLFVNSGGTCLRMICPGGMKQTSNGKSAPPMTSTHGRCGY
jgi:hypothetical protein